MEHFCSSKLPCGPHSLPFTEIIDVYANAMTGSVPSQLAKLPRLQELDLHDNFFVGSVPKEMCLKKLKFLAADCYGRKPEVTCSCCTHCCEGLPHMRCVDMKTNEAVIIGASTEKRKKKKASTTSSSRKYR